METTEINDQVLQDSTAEPQEIIYDLNNEDHTELEDETTEMSDAQQFTEINDYNDYIGDHSNAERYLL